MAEIIALTAIVFIIGGAIGYSVKAKKSGVKCIGCPNRRDCAKKAQEESEKTKLCCCCKHDD